MERGANIEDDSRNCWIVLSESFSRVKISFIKGNLKSNWSLSIAAMLKRLKSYENDWHFHPCKSMHPFSFPFWIKTNRIHKSVCSSPSPSIGQTGTRTKKDTHLTAWSTASSRRHHHHHHDFLRTPAIFSHDFVLVKFHGESRWY